MIELIEAYVDYLNGVTEAEIPKMPRFDQSAYTDNEYLHAIKDIMNDYEDIDDYACSIEFLKGE